MLPIYEAKIVDEQDGLLCISIVDDPAIESQLLLFNKNKFQTFSIQNEEQQIILGAIMIADKLIYRYSEELGEYYIKYSAETIKQMSQKMMKDHTFENISFNHDGQLVTGIEMLECFLKDTAKGINPKGFEDIADGSLFASFKVTDKSLWDKIKSLNGGFSLEGMFGVEKAKYSKKQEKQTMLKKFKKITKKLLLKYASVETKEGVTLFWEGEEALQVGDEVYTEVDGDRLKLEDGEYHTEDGTTITVEGGLVTYISTETEMEDETPAEIETVEDVIEVVEDVVEDVVEEVVEDVVVEETVDLATEIEALKAEIEALKKAVEEIKGTPAEEAVEEAYKKFAKQKQRNIMFGGSPTLVGIR